MRFSVYLGKVRLRRWLGLGVWLVASVMGQAQTPTFTRPGSMMVTDVVGGATVVAGGAEKALKIEERLRAEVTFKTERKSALELEFSNGTLLRLGADSEIVVEEFWQQPHSQPGKIAEWKEEPSPSRGRLRLVRGDFIATVKPLKTARGSSFTVELIAGTLRVTSGVILARVQMTDLGIGLCTLELREGLAEFEPVGGKFAPLPAGKRLALALEVDSASGAVKIGEMPKVEEGKK